VCILGAFSRTMGTPAHNGSAITILETYDFLDTDPHEKFRSSGFIFENCFIYVRVQLRFLLRTLARENEKSGQEPCDHDQGDG
jgi:hypothetical protein